MNAVISNNAKLGIGNKKTWCHKNPNWACCEFIKVCNAKSLLDNGLNQTQVKKKVKMIDQPHKIKAWFTIRLEFLEWQLEDLRVAKVPCQEIMAKPETSFGTSYKIIQFPLPLHSRFISKQSKRPAIFATISAMQTLLRTMDWNLAEKVALIVHKTQQFDVITAQFGDQTSLISK